MIEGVASGVIGEDYLSAEDAASELGIAVRTLYSYVSRKRMRSVAVDDGDRKRRLYNAEDVRRLKSTARLTGVAAPRSTLVDRSSITEVTPNGPYYRGRSAIDLSETETLESVGELLLQAPGAFAQAPPAFPASLAPIRRAVAHLSVADQAISLFPLLEEINPKAHDLTTAGFARTSVDVVRYYAALFGHAEQPSDEPVHSYLIRDLGADPALEDMVRRTLVLMADHDLDPTTYAVRALANTGATPFQAASVGLAAFRGRRLQFGRSELVNRMVDDIVASPDPSRTLVRSFRNGTPLVGFGSIVYGARDPRGEVLLERLNEQFGDDLDVRRLNDAVAVGHDLTGAGPSVMLLIAFLRHRLRLPVGDVSFIVLGRIVGWCAHAEEQFRGRDLFRPRSL